MVFFVDVLALVLSDYYDSKVGGSLFLAALAAPLFSGPSPVTLEFAEGAFFLSAIFHSCPVFPSPSRTSLRLHPSQGPPQSFGSDFLKGRIILLSPAILSLAYCIQLPCGHSPGLQWKTLHCLLSGWPQFSRRTSLWCGGEQRL